MERAAMAKLVIAVMQRCRRIRQESRKAVLALDQRPRPEIFAVEVEKIESPLRLIGIEPSARRPLSAP